MIQNVPKYYPILEFPLPHGDTEVKYCLGLIGILLKIRKSKYNVCYIPSKFIQPLNTKAKLDLIAYLISHNYIEEYQRKKKEEPNLEDNVFIIGKSGRGFTLTELKRGFKKPPHLYMIKPKLDTLRPIELKDERMTTWIDKHLHLLYDIHFNHYNHSYKHIRISLPEEERNHVHPEGLAVIDDWGEPDMKDYHIWDFGFDDNTWAGEHINVFTDKSNNQFFTDNRHLLKYTSLNNPIEIGLLFSKYIILADQLLKTIGQNDFSDYYYKSRFKNSLVMFLSDYDLTQIIFSQQLDTAIFGYTYIKEFALKFPRAWQILHSIKGGGKGSEPFVGYTKNLKPPIFKSDYRLHLEEGHPALRSGRAYYLIISLVCKIIEVKLMREIWKRLKKCGIIFIPLESSVVVSEDEEIATTYIAESVFKNYFDRRLKVVVLKRKIKKGGDPLDTPPII